jgi:hypothetical protein
MRYTLDPAHTHIDDKPAYEDVEALAERLHGTTSLPASTTR